MDIIKKIEIRSLGYFGHVARMDQNRLPYIAYMEHDAEEDIEKDALTP